MYEHVAPCVGGAHLNGPDLLLADATTPLASEGLVRRRHLDPLEVECAKSLAQKCRRGPGGFGLVDHRVEHGRGHFAEFRSRGLRGHHARALDQLVAVAVVAVRVGIDEGSDALCRRLGPAHRLEHCRGELQIEERVDEQRFAGVDHETRVAPTPGTIRLEPSIDPVPEIV